MIVPGGGPATSAAMADDALVGYVRSAARGAELVGSTGNGALLLAAADLVGGRRTAIHWAYREPLEELGGLLEGRDATTNWFYSGILEKLGAKYHVRRWVEEGNLIMSAGVSAGIDMALYLVARLTDEATARKVQLAIDYDPQPPYGGIDYTSIPPVARAMRGAVSVLAPAIAARTKRIARSEEPDGGRTQRVGQSRER